VTKWRNAFRTSEELHRFKRYAVLREATRIISRRGFHNTSLDEIAEGLGISKGTLYNYVSDKQEILFDCHMIALDLGDQASKVANDLDGSGLDKLRLLLLCYIEWMYGEAGIGGITSDINALRPDDRATVVARRDNIDQALLDLINLGIRDGSLVADDPHLAVFVIMGAVNSISSWYSRGGRLKIDEIADVIVGMLTRSIAIDTSNTKVRVEVPPHPEATLTFAPMASARTGRVATAKKAGSPKAKPAGASRKKSL
jgi:AcrR family transcriptional regulator